MKYLTIFPASETYAVIEIKELIVFKDDENEKYIGVDKN